MRPIKPGRFTPLAQRGDQEPGKVAKSAPARPLSGLPEPGKLNRRQVVRPDRDVCGRRAWDIKMHGLT